MNSFDRKDFARLLAAWIDPFAVQQVVREIDLDPSVFDRSATFVIGNAHSAPIVSELTLDLLREFRIPEEILTLIKSRRDATSNAGVWPLLSKLDFSKIELRVQNDSELLLRGPYAEITVSQAPLRMLVRTASGLVEQWNEHAKLIPNVYLLHSSDGPLLAYIESRVVAACHSADACRMASTRHGHIEMGPVINYRAVTLFGKPPIDRRLVDAAKETARHQAAQTNEPI